MRRWDDAAGGIGPPRVWSALAPLGPHRPEASPRATSPLCGGEKTRLSHTVRAFPSPLGEGGRRPDEGDSSCWHRDLPLTLALSQGRGNAVATGKSAKLIRPPPTPGDNGFGFRDGRHELSHLCPEASGACPRLGDDSPKLRQGLRTGPGALNDRPHVPAALETGWRQPGKTPRAGCQDTWTTQSHRTHRCPPASRSLPPALRRAEPKAWVCGRSGEHAA